MKVYRVTGIFPQGEIREMKFTKDVIAGEPAIAKEKILSLIGSKHRVKRRFVKILEIKEIDPKETIDPSIKAKLDEVST